MAEPHRSFLNSPLFIALTTILLSGVAAPHIIEQLRARQAHIEKVQSLSEDLRAGHYLYYASTRDLYDIFSTVGALVEDHGLPDLQRHCYPENASDVDPKVVEVPPTDCRNFRDLIASRKSVIAARAARKDDFMTSTVAVELYYSPAAVQQIETFRDRIFNFRNNLVTEEELAFIFEFGDVLRELAKAEISTARENCGSIWAMSSSC